MIGGLFKSSSRVAMLAAAGLLSGGVAAQAADLGGNCCADLEERVAELEATTVRKGNRKVSLTVSGHVNEGILYWDDGFEENVYIVTNVQSRTRFRFKGKAQINADWSAGFLIEIGLTRPGSSLNVDQENDDETLGDGIDVRHQALWVKSKRLGTVWLGHTSDATDGITQVCLGCTMGNYGSTAFEDIANSFFLRSNQLGGEGRLSDNIGTTMFSAEGTRQAVIKWISPTIAGFSLSSSYSDDDAWGVALRYAGEFGQIRVAAGVGYSENTTGDADQEEVGGSVSIAHTPTGLYVAGSYGEETNNTLAAGQDDESDVWHVAAGINAKWIALGKTHLGGYYAEFDGGFGGDVTNSGVNTPAFDSTVLGSDVEVWGITLNQKIDAAAMEVYIQYHNFSGDLDTAAGELELEDFDVVYAGARIKF